MFRAPLCPSSGVQGIWFSALKMLAGVLGRREAGCVHCVETDFRKSVSTQCTRPAFRRPTTPASTLSAENHMQ